MSRGTETPLDELRPAVLEAGPVVRRPFQFLQQRWTRRLREGRVVAVEEHEVAAVGGCEDLAVVTGAIELVVLRRTENRLGGAFGERATLAVEKHAVDCAGASDH